MMNIPANDLGAAKRVFALHAFLIHHLLNRTVPSLDAFTHLSRRHQAFPASISRIAFAWRLSSMNSTSHQHSPGIRGQRPIIIFCRTFTGLSVVTSNARIRLAGSSVAPLSGTTSTSSVNGVTSTVFPKIARKFRSVR